MTKPEIKSLKKKHQGLPESMPSSQSHKGSKLAGSGNEDNGEHQKQSLSKPELKNNASVQPENREADGKPDVFFQAVGIIEGAVSFPEDKEPIVTLEGREYSLFPQSVFRPRKVRKKLRRLKRHIDNTGVTKQRLLVYPCLAHFPQPDKNPQEIAFNVIKFDYKIGENATSLLGNNEFLLYGLWQYLPNCSLPCVSVFKNPIPYNLSKLESKDCIKRAKLLTPSHIPLLWENPSVKPFHYNPQLNELDQDSPMFIRIKARFFPQNNQFQFQSEIEPPLKEPPRFLKPTEEVRKAAEEAMRQNSEVSTATQDTANTQFLTDYEQGLTAIALAKRLGVSASTVGNQSRKSKAEFACWSSCKDPQGWAWQRYDIPSATGKGKPKPRYFPQFE